MCSAVAVSSHRVARPPPLPSSRTLASPAGNLAPGSSDPLPRPGGHTAFRLQGSDHAAQLAQSRATGDFSHLDAFTEHSVSKCPPHSQDIAPSVTEQRPTVCIRRLVQPFKPGDTRLRPPARCCESGSRGRLSSGARRTSVTTARPPRERKGDAEQDRRPSGLALGALPGGAGVSLDTRWGFRRRWAGSRRFRALPGASGSGPRDFRGGTSSPGPPPSCAGGLSPADRAHGRPPGALCFRVPGAEMPGTPASSRACWGRRAPGRLLGLTAPELAPGRGPGTLCAPRLRPDPWPTPCRRAAFWGLIKAPNWKTVRKSKSHSGLCRTSWGRTSRRLLVASPGSGVEP